MAKPLMQELKVQLAGLYYRGLNTLFPYDNG
jgi:hypothetical protein